MWKGKWGKLVVAVKEVKEEIDVKVVDLQAMRHLCFTHYYSPNLQLILREIKGKF